MPRNKPPPTRFIGLDVHKHYLIAIGVDVELDQVLGPQRVQLARLEKWMLKTLTHLDAVALEMTHVPAHSAGATNAFQLYDDLLPHVQSVTLVHPPHVKLITRAQVITDKIAAMILARLHAVLHRHHILPCEGGLFTADAREWWLGLPVTRLERVRVQGDLDTLTFAQSQVDRLQKTLVELAAHDERVVLLVQLPGISIVNALTLLAAIGDISRFPSAKHLVGYAGLRARVHDSGQTRRTGKITKAGRRDLRTAMVEAAHTAARVHPHWGRELRRLEPRLGHNKAIVAIARKLLVAVWHVLTKECADRFIDPVRIARKLTQHANCLGKANRPAGQTVGEYVRRQFDRLGLAADLAAIQWGKRRIPLPPSQLVSADL